MAVGNGPVNVLVTSIGSTGAQGLLKALRRQEKYPVRLIGCDAMPLVAGRHLVDRFFRVPHAREAGYVQALLDICASMTIELLFPVMEKELEAMAEHQDLLARHGPVISSAPVIHTCNDKLLTEAMLRTLGIRTPESIPPGGPLRFPCLVKPRRGTGSQGIHVCQAPEEWREHYWSADNLVQEFVQGTEYTVDTLTLRAGAFVGAVPRQRLAVKGGLAVQTLTVHHPALCLAAEKIVRALPIIGPANIQFIEARDGDLFCTDVNPRIGGAYIASMHAGLNAPLFLLDELMGAPIAYGGYEQGLLMSRFWEETIEHGHLV